MSSDDAALLRLLALSSRAELRGLRREGVLTEGVMGVEESLSISDLHIWVKRVVAVTACIVHWMLHVVCLTSGNFQSGMMRIGEGQR